VARSTRQFPIVRLQPPAHGGPSPYDAQWTLAFAITIRAAREKLPFSLTWWSFTFPVGTRVTRTFHCSVIHGTLFAPPQPVA
jgi:hypothetical protein